MKDRESGKGGEGRCVPEVRSPMIPWETEDEARSRRERAEVVVVVNFMVSKRESGRVW